MNKTEKKFFAVKAIISPFTKTKTKTTFDYDNFAESRLCVIDSDETFVVDVIHGLKYDYIKTINGVYYKPGEMEKIVDGQRYAIYSDYIGCTEGEQKMALEAIRLLEEGYEFPEGNEVLNNIDYYNVIQNEKNLKKRFIKRKKR